MPRIYMSRFSARLETDDSRLIACTEWVLEEGMFLIFLTVPPYTDREMVAACKRITYVPATMRGVLEGWMAHAHRTQFIDRNVLKLPQHLARRARA